MRTLRFSVSHTKPRKSNGQTSRWVMPVLPKVEEPLPDEPLPHVDRKNRKEHRRERRRATKKARLSDSYSLSKTVDAENDPDQREHLRSLLRHYGHLQATETIGQRNLNHSPSSHVKKANKLLDRPRPYKRVRVIEVRVTKPVDVEVTFPIPLATPGVLLSTRTVTRQVLDGYDFELVERVSGRHRLKRLPHSETVTGKAQRALAKRSTYKSTKNEARSELCRLRNKIAPCIPLLKKMSLQQTDQIVVSLLNNFEKFTKLLEDEKKNVLAAALLARAICRALEHVSQRYQQRFDDGLRSYEREGFTPNPKYYFTHRSWIGKTNRCREIIRNLGGETESELAST